MKFEQKYPVALNELLLAPIVFREGLPELASAPQVSARSMTTLAEFGGHSAGAIRTALSRLRAGGDVDTSVDARGVTRYRLAALGRSIGATVRQRPTRPDGLLLAIFSFAADDSRERQAVREALRLYGFHKLAQNVYVNGEIDTRELEEVFRREGVSEHVYLLRCHDSDDPALRRKLSSLFDLEARKRVLAAFREDLSAWLEAPKLDDASFARRFLYSGPVHYRLTFTEEPPVPASWLPSGYSLDEVRALLPRLAKARARALVRFFED